MGRRSCPRRSPDHGGVALSPLDDPKFIGEPMSAERWRLVGPGLLFSVAILVSRVSHTARSGDGRAALLDTAAILAWGAAIVTLLWLWASRYRRVARRLGSLDELDAAISKTRDPLVRTRLVSIEYEMARATVRARGRIASPVAYVNPERWTRARTPQASIPYVVFTASAFSIAGVAVGIYGLAQLFGGPFFLALFALTVSVACIGFLAYTVRKSVSPAARHLRSVRKTARLDGPQRWSSLLELASVDPASAGEQRHQPDGQKVEST